MHILSATWYFIIEKGGSSNMWAICGIWSTYIQIRMSTQNLWFCSIPQFFPSQKGISACSHAGNEARKKYGTSYTSRILFFISLSMLQSESRGSRHPNIQGKRHVLLKHQDLMETSNISDLIFAFPSGLFRVSLSLNANRLASTTRVAYVFAHVFFASRWAPTIDAWNLISFDETQKILSTTTQTKHRACLISINPCHPINLVDNCLVERPWVDTFNHSTQLPSPFCQ